MEAGQETDCLEEEVLEGALLHGVPGLPQALHEFRHLQGKGREGTLQRILCLCGPLSPALGLRFFSPHEVQHDSQQRKGKAEGNKCLPYLWVYFVSACLQECDQPVASCSCTLLLSAQEGLRDGVQEAPGLSPGEVLANILEREERLSRLCSSSFGQKGDARGL